ncbi:MAG: hypothetical protein KDE20_25835, partial [Caldilineaceae bacterium]|nr:hypothetical protein [Caldilineaceae bacterium]
YQRRVADMLQHELHPSRLARFIDKQRVFCLVCKDWFAGGRKAWTKYSAIRTTLDLPDVTAKRLLRELCETDGLLERYRDYYYPTEGGAQLWAGWQGIVMDPLPVQRVPQTRLTDDTDIAELAQHIATIDQTPRTYPLYAHDLNLALRELFIVQVAGASLQAESIRDGDLLLVKRFSGERPADGRLVLAGVRTPEATHTVIRHYHHDPTTGMVELRPPAPQHVSLYVAEEDVLIFGTPIRVIRELG